LSDDQTIGLNDIRLKKLIEAFSGKTPVARVGILGSTNARGSEFSTNAEIGALHEFGGAKMPKRSFLRQPLTDHLKERLEQAGMFDPAALDRVVKEGSIGPWVKKIALTALDVVLGAFETGGYGKWRPSRMSRKKVKMTLVETQQLRNSITEDVV
jgi:phage gpG-like protein